MIVPSSFAVSKLKQMNNKWTKKEDEKQKKEKENLTPEMRQLLQYEEDMKRIREQRPKADINAKLKAGADLTEDEIEYLKKNDPEAYREYEEIKREKENYKKQLKNCKTKEDVERLKMNKMGQFMAEVKNVSQNANIPKARKLQLMEKILKKTMAIQEVHIKFTQTSQYQSLPTEEEEQEKEAKKKEKVQLELEPSKDIMTEEKTTEEKPTEELELTEKSEESKELKKSDIRPTAEFEETKTVIMQELKRFSQVRGSIKSNLIKELI